MTYLMLNRQNINDLLNDSVSLLVALKGYTLPTKESEKAYMVLSKTICDLRYDVDTGRMFEVKLEEL